MHRKTFEIYMEVQDEKTPNDWFFVDDMIAPSIQLLNRNGYTTEWCCAGHPFIGCINVHPQSGVECKCEEFFTRELYVSFAAEVTALPPLPEGFYTTTFRGKLDVRYKYPTDMTDAYDIMAKGLEINRKFYNWTLQIPEYKSLNIN